jgi:uncharacterized protein YbaP (TraB family)
MKKLKSFVLLLCFSFLLCGCTKQEKVDPINQNTPLLFEVTKNGTENKLYLFGSIHAAEESLYPLPNYVMDAYKKSKVLAVEFDLVEYMEDLPKQMSDLTRFVNPENKKISDYISAEIYEESVQILTNAGLYSFVLDSYSPIMWYTLLENAAIEDVQLETLYGVDQYFLQLAKEDEKEILELESADYQYAVLSSFDYEMQAYLLEQGVSEYEKSKQNLLKLYELYKKGNKEELEEIVFSEDDRSNSYMEEYTNKLVTVRNQNMAASLEKSFEKGQNIFCTIGLAHIIGEGGILDLLSQNGYVVTIVNGTT